VHANLILSKLFKFSLTGETPGDDVLTLAWSLQSGKFLQNHVITTGVQQLYEGVTICYPTRVPPSFEVLAHSTDDHPVILYAEKTKDRGRIVVDCGWTKLLSENWQKTVGTSRYVTNAVCWLTGISVSNEFYLLQQDQLSNK